MPPPPSSPPQEGALPEEVSGDVARALHDLAIDMPQGTQGALGRWTQAHIQVLIAARRPIRFWHWGMTVLACILEDYGLHRAAMTQPEQYDNVMVEAGFTARARRQRPFTTWVEGRAAKALGINMPGTMAQGGRIFGTLRRALQAGWGGGIGANGLVGLWASWR